MMTDMEKDLELARLKALADKAFLLAAELEMKRRSEVLLLSHQIGGTTEDVLARADAYIKFLAPSLKRDG